ncbi:MAG: hypothetical protein U0Y96_12315 [Candidatus Kapaibacterium sp.]
MSMYKHIILLYFIFIISIVNVHAQTDTTIRFRFGGILGTSILLHTTNFQSLPGFPTCCPQFHSGSGFAPAAGIFIEIPLSEHISHSLRASLSDLSGTIIATEIQPVIVSSVLRNARISHQINTSIKGIGFEPLINFRASNQLGLFAGFRFDMGLSGSATTKEELIEPETGTFENGSRIRNVQEGSLIGLQPVVVSALGGMRFHVPLNTDNSLIMLPELSFAFGLSHVTGGDDWRVHAFRFGIGIAFQAPKIESIKLNTTVTPTLATSIVAVPYDGIREQPGLPVSIIENKTVSIQPILPMIFFEQNNDALPSKYRLLSTSEVSNTIDTTQFIGNTALESYYSILNIIGYRLRAYSSETITLVAVTTTLHEEAKTTSLPLQRAENVSRCLQQVWGIDKKRIVITVRTIPESETGKLLSKEERADYRRVEIQASNIILSPLIRNDYLWQSSPRFLRFRPTSVGTELIDRWELAVRQMNNTIKVLSGNGELPLRLQVDLGDEDIRLTDQPIVANLIVYGKGGIAASDNITISSRLQSVKDKKLNNIQDTITIQTLVLSNTIPNTATTSSLSNTIKPFLLDAGLVSMSDDKSVNDILQSLKSVSSDSYSFTTIPVAAPYSNYSPESRFYNKSATIIIKTWNK